MQRPALIILGIGILAGLAIGFLTYSTSPFTSGAGIIFLFLASVFIVTVALLSLVLYGIAVAWHEGMRYFLAKYFGPEASYFKSTFQSAVLITAIAMLIITLRRFGLLSWK